MHGINNKLKLHTLTTKNMKSHLSKIRKTAESKIIKLHQHGVISKDLLEHTVGIKICENNANEEIPVALAKHFTGYAYPRFKTHKSDVNS